MSTPIDLVEVVDLFVYTLLTDPEDRDVETEADDLIKVINYWFEQQLEAIEAATTPAPAPVVTTAPPVATMCTFGRPLRDHARPCAPGCDFRA